MDELFAPIYEFCHVARASPSEMDGYWANGWRHFGTTFFRYSMTEHEEELVFVQPLRLPLKDFQFTKSQRRLLRRNVDLEIRIGPTVIDDERRELFEVHKARFTNNVPNGLEDFLGFEPARVPCRNIEFAAYSLGQLVAASFLDLGQAAVSAVYASFDPSESSRGLGIVSMLWEIQYAIDQGFQYYYPGYAYHQPSHYDYKKRFQNMEWFHWDGNWQPLLADKKRRNAES